MKKQIELIVFPEKIYDQEFITNLSAKKLKINPKDIKAVRQLRRSIDARQNPVFKILLDVFIGEPLSEDNPKYIDA